MTLRHYFDSRELTLLLEESRSCERSLKSRIKTLTQESQNFRRFSGNSKRLDSENTRLGRQHVSKPSPRGTLSARDYNFNYSSNSASRIASQIPPIRGRSNSRDSQAARQRSLTRSPSSKFPSKRPPQNPQVSSRSRRFSKDTDRSQSSFRIASRSPSPATRAVTQDSISKHVSRLRRTPSVSSIASNNSDISISFGISMPREKSIFTRKAPVSKSVAADVRNFSRGNSKLPRVKTDRSFNSVENYLEKSSILESSIPKRLPKEFERTLRSSQMDNRAHEMQEIDARLKRLHNLLKENDIPL